MTQKLYETDSHLAACEARVLRCTAGRDGYDATFARTVFFPEAGGQPCDLGTAGASRVLHVREEGGELVHTLDAPLPEGETVSLTVDWARRFDFMQQHTGEHLFSFACHKLFSAHNVGFHLAERDYMTVDLDLPLSREQLDSVQSLVNEYIWRDLPVTAACYESEAEIAALPLRKHAEGLTPPIRVVAIEDADMCTCCAPHCARTGEIGSLLVLDAAAYKGGTRVFLVCGARALSVSTALYETVDGMARSFSCARETVAAAVEKCSAELSTARRDNKELTAKLNGYLSAELSAAAETNGRTKLIVRLLENVDASRLRALALGVLSERTLCVLLCRDRGKLAYAVACSEGFSPDAGELIQAVNAAAGGKGGGRGTFAQGMAPSDAGAAETAQQLCAYCKKRLGFPPEA